MRRTAAVIVAATATAVAGGCAVDHTSAAEDAPRIQIGSKVFTESVILGEITRQLAAAAGARAEHRKGLGGTRVCWSALTNGDIDAYPEYTGTIREEIFAGRELADDDAIRAALAENGIAMTERLGFNNSYAIGVKESLARELGISTISDLRRHPQLRFGFSNEFLERADGWRSLKAFYQLPQTDVRGMQHDLAYRGLESGAIDATELYTTDAEIPFYNLRALEDDRHFYPGYDSVLLYRIDLADRAPEVLSRWQALENRISAEAMTAMNAASKLDEIPEEKVAADFLKTEFAVTSNVVVLTRTQRILKTTREHLRLVLISIVSAIVAAIPLGILAAKQPTAGQIILGVVGIMQTVPSLALFVVLIPLLGLGALPAIVALFFYSLLPIVRNTYTGLHEIPPPIHESGMALGLPSWARLRLIELPTASRSILAGIKTAAVINVGTATLGGFIGAGGYGEPIFSGIRLERTSLILEGAIPAAAMALLVQGLFELAERKLVPRGLRLRPQT